MSSDEELRVRDVSGNGSVPPTEASGSAVAKKGWAAKDSVAPARRRAGRGGKGLEKLRRSEAALDELALDEVAVRRCCREIYGVVERRERVPLRAGLEASGLGAGTLWVLWMLVGADAAVTASLLWASTAAQLSLGSGAPAAAMGLRALVFPVGGMAAVLLVGRWPARRAWAAGAAFCQSVTMVAAGFSSNGTELLGAGLILVLLSAMVAATALPMLMDACRPEIRLRAAGGFSAAVLGGIGLSGVVVSLSGGARLSWRAAFLLMAILPAAAGAAMLRLTGPEIGRFDRDRIRRLVDEHLHAPVGKDTDNSTNTLGVAARFSRVVGSFTSVRLLLGAAAFGAVIWGLASYLETFLRDRWGLVAPSRGLLLPAVMVAAVPGVRWGAGQLEVVFRRSPRLMVWRISQAGSIAAVALAAAVVCPLFALTVAALLVFLAAAGVVLAGTAFLLLTLVDPRYRDAAAVTLAGSVFLGGLVAGQTASAIGSRFGVEWSVVVPALLVLAWANTGLATRTVDADLNSVVGRLVEEEELSARRRLGQHLPLLACRHVDFSYGQVQVLFDVSLTVDDGEMVALLGTNGAGKTTLLRAVSGLAVPSAGSVHFCGNDVTFLGTDQRVGLGISQIPGGRAVFGPLTVADNLRAYGYTYGRRRSELGDAIEEVFSVFPKLYQRRDQHASTLSGGEQQMLGVAKAFLVRPRLLLIDELSLGLAPIVVGELLEMVRRINQTGTAVVLVEQSVNIALSLVDHAYFMEKGEMRFDGPAQQLLDRPDLLRSVFLQGATTGLAGTR